MQAEDDNVQDECDSQKMGDKNQREETGAYAPVAACPASCLLCVSL